MSGTRLAVSVWFAPAVWFIHLCAGLALATQTCRWGTELPIHVLTVVAIGLATFGGWSVWRHRAGDPAPGFVARIGVVLAALSVLAIVGVAAVPIDGCDL